MALPKWLEILKSVGPILVTTMVPGGAVLGPLIIGAIAEAEKMKGASGPEKKAAAIELVKAGANATNVIAKKTVVDPNDAAATATDAIDTVVGVVNMIEKANPEPAPAPVEPAPPQG